MVSSRTPEFVSESIALVPGVQDIGAMSRGEPGVPRAFVWRDRRYDVARVVSTGRAMGADRGDVYLRRHTYEIETTDALRMSLYFERNPSDHHRRKRWWLYTVTRPEPVIETARLFLRRWTYADRDDFRRMTADPDAMRHQHEGVPFSTDEADAALESTVAHYAHGYGDWAIVARDSGAILGESGLTNVAGSDEVEIGYMLERRHWGQGFAFEAAAAVFKQAFERHALRHLVAFVWPDNQRSIQLLEKLGMQRVGLVTRGGRSMLKYEASR